MTEPVDDIHCPVCGYYCLGCGGKGCIDKPALATPNSTVLREPLCHPCMKARGYVFVGKGAHTAVYRTCKSCQEEMVISPMRYWRKGD